MTQTPDGNAVRGKQRQYSVCQILFYGRRKLLPFALVGRLNAADNVCAIRALRIYRRMRTGYNSGFSFQKGKRQRRCANIYGNFIIRIRMNLM